jgi:hypothetical protein
MTTPTDQPRDLAIGKTPYLPSVAIATPVAMATMRADYRTRERS